jgi:hypothetical protein
MAGSSLAMFLLLSSHFNFFLTALFFFGCLRGRHALSPEVKKLFEELNINICEVMRLPEQALQHNVTQASPHLSYFGLQNCLANLDSVAFLCIRHIEVFTVISHGSLEVDLLCVHDLLLL